MPPAAGNLVVTSVGLTSSLGASWRQSCAAARAGLTRLGPLEGHDFLDESTGELVPLAGHVAAGGIAAGFRGFARMTELARLALVDLLASVRLEQPQRLPVVVSLGGSYYFKHGLLRALAGGPHPADAIANGELAELQAKSEASFVPRLGEQLGLAFQSRHSRVFFGEQASGGETLSYAAELLRSSNAPAVIVGGVSTLVDEDALDSLLDLNLLKTPTLDAGFFPGEAAAFVLLERADAARAAGRSPKAELRAVAFQRDAPDRLADVMPVGIELAEVIRLATGGGSSPAGPGFVLNSLNGDRWMSWEWGHAVPRLDAGVAAWPQWQPAESFGEIGAATMAAMICMAVAGYERGYARGAHALLCGIGNDGGRAAALVSRAS